MLISHVGWQVLILATRSHKALIVDFIHGHIQLSGWESLRVRVESCSARFPGGEASALSPPWFYILRCSQVCLQRSPAEESVCENLFRAGLGSSLSTGLWYDKDYVSTKTCIASHLRTRTPTLALFADMELKDAPEACVRSPVASLWSALDFLHTEHNVSHHDTGAVKRVCAGDAQLWCCEWQYQWTTWKQRFI